MLTVGTQSYVTLAEAEEYIATHVLSSGEAVLHWIGLDDSDKEILLRNACEAIDALPLVGRKLYCDQLLQFPRWPWFRSSSDPIPQRIKAAQIELALWASDTGALAESEHRAGLQRQGVQSFSLGDLSESYAAGGANKAAPLVCPKASQLLDLYISGGFETC